MVKNLPNKRVGSNCSIDVPTNLQVANYDSSMNYGLSFVGCFIIVGFFVVVYKKHHNDAVRKELENAGVG